MTGRMWLSQWQVKRATQDQSASGPGRVVRGEARPRGGVSAASLPLLTVSAPVVSRRPHVQGGGQCGEGWVDPREALGRLQTCR